MNTMLLAAFWCLAPKYIQCFLYIYCKLIQVPWATHYKEHFGVVICKDWGKNHSASVILLIAKNNSYQFPCSLLTCNTFKLTMTHQFEHPLQSTAWFWFCPFYFLFTFDLPFLQAFLSSLFAQAFCFKCQHFLQNTSSALTWSHCRDVQLLLAARQVSSRLLKQWV